MTNATIEHDPSNNSKEAALLESGLELLIRSADDAMIVYDEAYWFGDQDETAVEYELLGCFVKKWGSPEFTNWDANMMEKLLADMVSKTSGFLNDERDGMGYGLAEPLLRAVVTAAKKLTETDA